MVAVVVRSGRGRAVEFEMSGALCLIKVGKRASVRRVKKALRPFGDGYILSEDFESSFRSHFSEYDCSALRETLLFNMFVKTVAAGRFGKIGVVCTNTLTPLRAAELLSFVSELILVSAEFCEQFLLDCITQYGTCPDLGTFSDLYSCDAVLSVDGLANFEGVLLGKGGVTVCGDGLPLPHTATQALSLNADPIKLLNLLSAQTGEDLGSLCPSVVCSCGRKMSYRAFLNLIRKDFVVNSLGLV
ncbi:MAG: hypothetical protein E7525_07320 [Ruminococcaceae bacterium]|nr:hypothetical protein [Oscillospiraceae bacterium]